MTQQLTTNHQLPYYQGSDPADGASQQQALAQRLNLVIPRSLAAGGATNIPVLDVGMVGQTRAGRQLTVADFTGLGLSQPVGLWNLSDLTNLGSDGRALVNKGTVPFAPGVNGLASTAAQFAGSTGQALYIPDAGAADPLRIRTGSFGCWFRTAKRGTGQTLISKWGAPAGSNGITIQTNTTNGSETYVSTTGSDAIGVFGVSDVCDERWHFAVVTFDATALRYYIDGVLEGTATLTGTAVVFGATVGPLNIGARSADAATAAQFPHYGRVDEAFATADVLTEDQIRCLYAAKLTHSLPVAPTSARVNVHRRRRGAALATTDFPTQPLRLHNFTAGALTDQGSGNVTLAVNAAAPVTVAGADGSPAGAQGFAGLGNLTATDAGLPSGTAARSFGAWVKTTANSPTGLGIMGWGSTGEARLDFFGTPAVLRSLSGGDQITLAGVNDGQWHLVVAVDDNAAGDGVRRKLYLDGRLVGGSTVFNALTLAGATRFRVGSNGDGGASFAGQIDAAFVCGYALTFEQQAALYAKGGQDLGASPKNEGDHVERLAQDGVLFIGDTLDSSYTVDVGVSA